MTAHRLTNESRKRSDAASKATSLRMERRQCPKCRRRGALSHHSDDFSFGTYCRYEDCDYEDITQRDFDV